LKSLTKTRLLLIAATATIALAAPSAASAAGKGAVVQVKTATVGAPGNASVAIVPFTDAIYKTCAEAPPGQVACQEIGGVDYGYGIGYLEVTVRDWVKFLNVADPGGRDPHKLYDSSQSAAAWPKYGQIEKVKAPPGRRYEVASPEWADKPYGFANFLRAARFVNSLYNGEILTKKKSTSGAFRYTTYTVRLSPETERGMYDMARKKKTGTTRARKTGFVVPSQDEWVKAAYFDPNGGGTYSYWKYPTNAGVFGDGTATAPATTTLDPTSGDVTNTATQPLANYHASEQPAPSWCPSEFEASVCASANPFGIPAEIYAKAYQGSLSTVGQAGTLSPWGTLEQGGNAVEWTDTITPPPTGREGGRVWRRLHGGIANAPAYQLWLSAVGLQPQDNIFYDFTYPWLGFRIGVVGNLKVDRP
jgi:hypothetical protein